MDKIRKSGKNLCFMVIIALIALLASCDYPTSVTLIGDPDMSGVISSSNSVLNYTQIQVGDTSANFFCKGYLSFNIGGIPSDAIIETATVSVYLESVNGSPFVDLGPLLVDHVSYGIELEVSDFDTGLLVEGIASIATRTTDTRVEIPVTTYLQGDLTAARTHSQFRLRLTTDGDDDFEEDSLFFTRTGAVEFKPFLIVSYR